MKQLAFADDVPAWVRHEIMRWMAVFGGFGEWARVEVRMSDKPNDDEACEGAFRASHGVARVEIVFNSHIENDHNGRATVLHEIIECLYADVARMTDHVLATIKQPQARAILDSWLVDVKERFVERLAWTLTAEQTASLLAEQAEIIEAA